MKTTRLLRMGLVLSLAGALTLGIASDLRAQEPPEPPPGGGELDRPPPPEEMSEEERQRVQERIRVMRAWQLTEALEIDELTAVRLFEHLDSFDEQIEQEHRLLREYSNELRQLLESGEGSEERIGELVELTVATHLRVEELRAQQIREASTILDARQQAALMLFLPQFDRRIREMSREVRQTRHRTTTRRRPPPPSDERTTEDTESTEIQD